MTASHAAYDTYADGINGLTDFTGANDINDVARSSSIIGPDQPKASINVVTRQFMRRPAMRDTWVLASYIKPAHADALSAMAVISVSAVQYLIVGSYDGALSVWTVYSSEVLERRQQFTLNSAAIRILQASTGAIVVCRAGEIYHLSPNGQIQLGCTLNHSIIYADLALPSPYLVVVSKTNCVAAIETTAIFKTGSEGNEAPEKGLKEMYIDVSSAANPATNKVPAEQDGPGESARPSCHQMEQMQVPASPADALAVVPEDSDIELEERPTRTAHIVSAALLTPTLIAVICSHGYFYLYNYITERLIIQTQLYRNVVPICIAAHYSAQADSIPDRIYTASSDGSTTVWSLHLEKKEILPIAVKSNSGSTVSCIELTDPNFILLGLTNGKTKVYKAANISRSVAVCRTAPDDPVSQSAGVTCAVWLNPDTIVSAGWDRGIFVYVRAKEQQTQHIQQAVVNDDRQ